MPRPRLDDAERFVSLPLRVKPEGKARLAELAAERGTDRSEAARVLLALGDAEYRRLAECGTLTAPRAGDLP